MYVRSPPGRKCLKAGAQRTLEGVGSSAMLGHVVLKATLGQAPKMLRCPPHGQPPSLQATE